MRRAVDRLLRKAAVRLRYNLVGIIPLVYLVDVFLGIPLLWTNGNMTQSANTDDEVKRLRRRLAKVEQELQVEHDTLAMQLRLAAKVHSSLLPKSVRHERVSIDVRYQPVEEVGGDYCQVRFSDPDTCYITMCDVTGHGIGAALMATRVSSQVRHNIVHGSTPSKIVESLNRFICDYFEEAELYLTFMAARIDFRNNQITWCGAGHPCPLLIRRDGRTVQQLNSENSMIGIVENCLSEDPEHLLPLQPGDRLLFYTDGLTETADADGRCLGTKGLSEIGIKAQSISLFEAADYILQRVADYQCGPVTDDKTLIVVEIK